MRAFIAQGEVSHFVITITISYQIIGPDDKLFFFKKMHLVASHVIEIRFI